MSNVFTSCGLTLRSSGHPKASLLGTLALLGAAELKRYIALNQSTLRRSKETKLKSRWIMEINIDRKLLKKEIADVDLMLRKIATGKAILFTGAGFSTGTSNVNGEAPPRASDLSKVICQLGEFPEDEDLRYSSDYYMSSGCDKAKLIALLKKNYTLSKVGDVHKNICTPKWRRFYTTNYDKGVEIAASNIGKVVECIDINYPTTEYYKREHLCVHLNGSIDSLTSDSLESGFKLSTSSYTDLFEKFVMNHAGSTQAHSGCRKNDLIRSGVAFSRSIAIFAK